MPPPKKGTTTGLKARTLKEDKRQHFKCSKLQQLNQFSRDLLFQLTSGLAFDGDYCGDCAGLTLGTMSTFPADDAGSSLRSTSTHNREVRGLFL